MMKNKPSAKNDNKMDVRTDILWRVYAVYSGIVLFALLIIIQIIRIQVGEKDELLRMAEEREIRFRKEVAHRSK